MIPRIASMAPFILANMTAACTGAAPRASETPDRTTNYQAASDQPSVIARRSTLTVSAELNRPTISARLSRPTVTATLTPPEYRFEERYIPLGQGYDFTHQLALERGYSKIETCLVRYKNDDDSIVLPKTVKCFPEGTTQIPASFLKGAGYYILSVKREIEEPSSSFHNIQLFFRVVRSDKGLAPLRWGDFVLPGYSEY